MAAGLLGEFAGFLDDAAVFPPGNASLRDALPAHRSYHDAWYKDMVGPFVFPVARLGELTHGGHDLDGIVLSVTTPAASLSEVLAGEVLAGEVLAGTVRLAAVEIVPAGDVCDLIARLDASLPDAVAGYIEVPRGEQRDRVLDAIAGTRYRAKFRTGGTVPRAHPGERELASALHAAIARGLPFKCTAGLHHAVRHTDGELEQHGFLNVLRATHALQQGATADEAAGILADRESPLGLTGDVVATARASFVSFGTCSITEPVADLVALELINVDGLRSR
jgi:hypothetical protein